MEDLPELPVWEKQEQPALDLPDGVFVGHLCVETLGEFTTAGPLGELDDWLGISYASSEKIHVNELALAASADALSDAYDVVVQQLKDCLADPSRWAEGLNDDDAFQLADHLDMAPVGDRVFGYEYQAFFDADDQFCSHRVALVLNGTRMIVVELVEAFPDSKETFAEEDFTQLVANAVGRMRT